MTSTTSCCKVEEVHDKSTGLHVQLHHGYQSHKAQYWWDTINANTRWYRVRYKSGRFGKDCETPCWTTFYGGRTEYSPYEPVPDWLQPLVEEVSADLNMTQPFNAMLLRLYFDGEDEIAWHTDGRTFLGKTPTIASLSFGANATFQMRRMTNVWPPLDGSAGNCIDKSTPQRDFIVGDGDMLVMMGSTQAHWHHRVPKERGRRPRLNINFRYIMGGPDAERGQKTYYKYMVHGDERAPKSYTYNQIMAMRGGLLNFAKPKETLSRATVKKTTGDAKNDRRLSGDVPSCEVKCSMNDPSASNGTNACGGGDETAAYLASEGIDESTFESLPDEIRAELLNDWKARQRPSVEISRAAAGGGTNETSHSVLLVGSSSSTSQKSKAAEVSAKKRPAPPKNGTLDAFFGTCTSNSKKKSHFR